MKKPYIITSLILSGIAFGQNITMHLDTESMLFVAPKALLYNLGGWESDGNGKAEVKGNVMLTSITGLDIFRNINGNNENFFLRYDGDQYGQLYISGFRQENITGIVNREYIGNKHGDYQQFGLPFFGKTFSELAGEFSATLSEQRWSKKEVLKFNNRYVRFDGSIIPSAPISSANTPGITVLLSATTAEGDKTAYYTIGTAGGFDVSKISVIKGVPYSDQLQEKLEPQSVDFGTGGSATNIYREKYNTYLSDIFEAGNPWANTYGKYIYQFANPFLTNIDLSLIGIDEMLSGATLGDNNEITNIWGIAINPNNVNFNDTDGTSSDYATNQIVTFDENHRPVGNIDALLIKPFGTFKIKLRNADGGILHFDNLRRFAFTTRAEDQSYNVAERKTQNSSTKQLGIILLDKEKKQIGETYYVVSENFQTGKISNPSYKGVQAIATSNNIISTYEEQPDGGIDQDLADQYRLYINEANSSDYFGKPIQMSIYGDRAAFIKFELRENAKITDLPEQFFYKTNGVLQTVINNEILPINSDSYTLYFGKPEEESLGTEPTKKSRTVVTYDPTRQAYVVLFDPSWKKAKVEVYDFAGRLIRSKDSISTVNNFVLDFFDKIQTSYIVRITSEKGIIVQTKIITK